MPDPSRCAFFSVFSGKSLKPAIDSSLSACSQYCSLLLAHICCSLLLLPPVSCISSLCPASLQVKPTPTTLHQLALLYSLSHTMVIRIRLSPHRRLPSSREIYYRIVVCNAPKARDSKPIETVGAYDPYPKHIPAVPAAERSLLDEGKPPALNWIKRVEWDKERVGYWLGVGAQPTKRVQWLLEKVSHSTFDTMLSTVGIVLNMPFRCFLQANLSELEAAD